MKYREIRSIYQDHEYLDKVFVDPYVMLISPLFTKIFIKLKIIPNYITVLMMISGIIGAILFAIPNFSIKVIGIVLIHLWYILDCSDGEVARITKKFSKFGKEIDYTAHILNHPLFNLSFAYAVIYINKYNNVIILFLFMILIMMDLVNRNLISFYSLYEIKLNNKLIKNNSNIKRLIRYIIRIFTEYPNFALIFPIVYYIDTYFNINLILGYLLIEVFIIIVVAARGMVKWIFKIVNL